jgi:hypothetical protein
MNQTEELLPETRGKTQAENYTNKMNRAAL